MAGLKKFGIYGKKETDWLGVQRYAIKLPLNYFLGILTKVWL